MSEHDEQHSSTQMLEAHDVPGTFVALMEGSLEGLVAVPIDVVERVFTELSQTFENLPKWAIEHQRNDVLEFCFKMHQAGVTQSVRALIATIAEALPHWREQELSVVLFHFADAPEGGKDPVTGEYEEAGMEVMPVAAADFDEVEQRFAMEPGVLGRMLKHYVGLTGSN